MSSKNLDILHVCCNRNPLYRNLWDQQREAGLHLRVFHFSHQELGLPSPDSSYAIPFVDACTPFYHLERASFFLKESKVYREFNKLYQDCNIRLIHAHTLFSDGYIAYRAQQERGIPYLVAVRNTDLNYFFTYRPYLIPVACAILEAATTVIFISEVYRKQLLKCLPAAFRTKVQNKSCVIPNGISPFYFENLNEASHVPASNTLHCLTVGNICPNKNQLFVCKSLKKIEKQGLKVHYCLIGKIDSPIYAKRLQRYPFVEMLPPQSKEDLLPYYRAADLHLLLSKKETFGLVNAEALSQGRPILYTQGQGFDGQLPEGKVGYPVNIRSFQDFEKKLLSVLQRYPEIQSQCTRAVYLFNWKDISEKLIQIYQSAEKRVP